MSITINGTSGISGVDGSAGTPALQGSDTNTGISFGADTVNINTGGTTRATVDSSGRVGIGTTPDVTLHVATGNATGYIKIDGGTSSSATGGILFKSGNNTYSADISHYQSNLSLYTAGSERARIDSSGNFAFNSGYGSVATAYGCRAWVNFNGTGTVAIRASGNVSSITDQGTGSYTINFTTAMPDVNYSLIATGGNVQLQYGAYALDDSQYRGRTTTACSVASYSASNNLDNQYMNIAIFR